MAEKKKVLYIVEAMGGGVFTYIVDLANELVNSYDMYIAYAVRKQTPENYKEYFDKRIHLMADEITEEQYRAELLDYEEAHRKLNEQLTTIMEDQK